jgi:TonB family protein
MKKYYIPVLLFISFGVPAVVFAGGQGDDGTNSFVEEHSETQRCPYGLREPFTDGQRTRLVVRYPDVARMRGIKGKVGLAAIIGCDGYAKTCEVVKSSGHQILDAAACDDVMNRSRFTPQTNDAGEFIEHKLETEINYSFR